MQCILDTFITTINTSVSLDVLRAFLISLVCTAISKNVDVEMTENLFDEIKECKHCTAIHLDIIGALDYLEQAHGNLLAQASLIFVCMPSNLDFPSRDKLEGILYLRVVVVMRTLPSQRHSVCGIFNQT